MITRKFRLWAASDAHVGTDLERGNRRSLAEAILQSERGGDEDGPPFDWDIMLNAGDYSGSQTPPDDEEGLEVVRQYSVSTKHGREDFYDLVGNHDASGADEETQWWFRKWVDPTGENSEYSGVYADRRPYPISGTWERYSFQVGNILFLIMGDPERWWTAGRSGRIRRLSCWSRDPRDVLSGGEKTWRLIRTRSSSPRIITC